VTECTLCKSADDTKLRGMPDTPERCVAIQRDGHRLEKCADKKLTRTTKGNAKSCPLEE